MALQKKDFIEIEFIGREKDGAVFDSNIKEELEKMNSKTPARPFVFCVGEEMFLKAIDEFLIGKEVGKKYEIELQPENAFGKRNPALVQMIPMKFFNQQKVRPYPGAVFMFDNRPAKILTVSGGRVMADFNNPLAGKTVVYEIRIKRKVEDINEKIKSLIEFFFKRELPFEVKDKKIIIQGEKFLADYAKLFADKFKELLDLELEVKELEKNKAENKN